MKIQDLKNGSEISNSIIYVVFLYVKEKDYLKFLN